MEQANNSDNNSRWDGWEENGVDIDADADIFAHPLSPQTEMYANLLNNDQTSFHFAHVAKLTGVVPPTKQGTNKETKQDTKQEAKKENGAELATTKHQRRSCLQCYQSRQRCNGERPCPRCISRGESSVCCDRAPSNVRKKKRQRASRQDMANSASDTCSSYSPRDGASKGPQKVTVIVIESMKGCGSGNLQFPRIRMTTYNEAPMKAKSDVATFCLWHTVIPGENITRKQVHINPAFTSLFGYSEDELISAMEHGKACVFFVVFADECQHLIESLTTNLCSGKPFQNTVIFCVSKFGFKFPVLLQANSQKVAPRAGETEAMEIVLYFSPIPPSFPHKNGLNM